MKVSHLMLASAVVLAPSVALAGEAVDPVFGSDPSAHAVLDCQARYAQRYAKSVPSATATEVATGATAHCAVERQAFARHALELAQSNVDTAYFAQREQEKQMATLNEYSFAYTIDAYLKSKALF